jgi:putative transposase
MSDLAPLQEPGRKHPARGVLISSQQPTIVYLTICTKDRRPWLANDLVHKNLEKVWQTADAWLVGYYLLMPDHLHLFCAPHRLEFALQRWVSHWKRKFSCLHLPEAGEWQRDCWNTRLRRGESYSEKWHYIQENPVKAKLVTQPEDWPYQGMLNVLRW